MNVALDNAIKVANEIIKKREKDNCKILKCNKFLDDKYLKKYLAKR